MTDILHDIYKQFIDEYPDISEKYEELGKLIHEKGGPLEERERWLIKIAVDAAGGHKKALETHIKKALECGLTDKEIKHCLILTMQSCGFPAFMEAYSYYRK